MFFGGGIPFGFGGPPGFGGQQQQEDESFYELLGVSQKATDEQIKSKYEQLKIKYGEGEDADPTKLELISEAVQILLDPSQRKQYDQQLEQQKRIFVCYEEMYEMMHGKKPEKGGNKQKPKMQPMKRQIDVSLDKLYKGGNVPLFHQRARMCEVCDGKGGPDVKKCSECKGEGAVVKMVQVAPGMYAQAQQNCTPCNGMGDIFGQGGKCQTCEGRKIVKKGIDLQVPIPPGAPAGHSITIENQGNEVQSVRAGDLILVIAQESHQTFTRKGADLFLKKSISLIEAILGFHFDLIHLDEKKYVVYTKPGQIVGDCCKKVLKGLGMPFFDEPEQHGNLIIQFKVIMPKRGELTPEQLKALSSCLPGQINSRPNDTNYEMLQDFDRENINSNEQGGKKEDDFEQDQEGGIGCQAQ